MAGGPDAPAIEVVVAHPDESVRISAAIALGNAAQATLGQLPFAAYDDAAAHGGLLLAVSGDEVVGYALFYVGRQRVRLAHLCVDPAWRRAGVARQLVEWISERHRDWAGISVWCRRDYRLAEFWSRLGFQRMGERPGRGRAGHTLVAWWRDHGHPSLFSALREGVVVRASVDLNVVRDIAEGGRANREESLALLGDQLRDQLELVRTPSLDIEIDFLEDTERRAASREAEALPSVRVRSSEVALIATALRSAVEELDPAFFQEVSGQRDLLYVSEAIAGGISVFITKDEKLAGALAEAALAYGLRVLRPAAVIVRIDELVRSEAYRPGPVQATAFTRRLIPSGSHRELEGLVATTGKARRTAALGHLRSLTTTGYDRVGIFDPVGELAGAYLLRKSGGVLEVPILRFRPGALAPTLVRQVLFALRREAVQRGAAAIRIADPQLDKATGAAAVDDGFERSGDDLVGLVIDFAGPARGVADRVKAAADTAKLPPPFTVRPHLPPIPAAEIERIWWPAKLLDSGLPNYIIPIQQEFSRELLGAPLGLFGRDAALGLSREHVYYRSPRGLAIEAPARLLWYMSGSAKGSVEPSAVVAASILEEVVEDSPEALRERFQHLGVWRLEQIERAARAGKAQALRFTYTETFARPVTGPALSDLLGSAPQGPRRLNRDGFALLYSKGHAGG